MKKSKNKKNNKSKLIILVSGISLLLLICVVIVVLIRKFEKQEDNDHKANEVSSTEIKDKAIELLYNNYLISYLLESDVQIGKGTLRIDGDDKVYYAVDDPVLSNIKSMEDITNLIEGNLSSEAIIRTKKLMDSEYVNKYISGEGTLYVSKTTTPCVVYEDGPIDKSKITYRNEDNKVYAIYDNVPFRGYYDDYNELKAPTLWFTCATNFPRIGIDKDSVYDSNLAENIDD